MEFKSLKELCARFIVRRGIAYADPREVVQDCIEYVDEIAADELQKRREALLRNYWTRSRGSRDWAPWDPQTGSIWHGSAGHPLDNIRGV